MVAAWTGARDLEFNSRGSLLIPDPDSSRFLGQSSHSPHRLVWPRSLQVPPALYEPPFCLYNCHSLRWIPTAQRPHLWSPRLAWGQTSWQHPPYLTLSSTYASHFGWAFLYATIIRKNVHLCPPPPLQGVPSTTHCRHCVHTLRITRIKQRFK